MKGVKMLALAENELDMVSGGHDGTNLEGAEYVGAINGTKDGQAGHYDVYQTADGCTVMVWNPGTTVNVDTGALESR